MLTRMKKSWGCPFCEKSITHSDATSWAWEKKDDKTWEWVRYITCNECGHTGREVSSTIHLVK